MKQVLKLLLLIFVWAVSGCIKDQDLNLRRSNGSSATHAPVITQGNVLQLIQDFPNKIGNQWIYKMTSSPYSFDSVKVEITGQLTLPNGLNAKTWTYEYHYPSGGYLLDSLWVADSANQVLVFWPSCFNCVPSKKLNYILPLAVGNSWGSSIYVLDTTQVLSQAVEQVPAGTFTNVFKVAKTVGYIANSVTQDTMFIKNKVGLIKYRQFEYSLAFGYGNGLWELVSYHVQ